MMWARKLGRLRGLRAGRDAGEEYSDCEDIMTC